MRDASAGKHNLYDSAGISTLEVLVAMAILVTTFATVILVVFGNQDVTLSSRNNNFALYRAAAMMEKAKAQGAADFANVISSKSDDSIFHHELVITDVNLCRKNATSRLTW